MKYVIMSGTSYINEVMLIDNVRLSNVIYCKIKSFKCKAKSVALIVRSFSDFDERVVMK